LGEQLRIGRGAGADKTVFIDAVVFAPDVKRALPADRPDPALAPQKIAATIDWNKSAATVSPLLWGINEHEILYPEKVANDPNSSSCSARSSDADSGSQRRFMDAWTDAKTRDGMSPKSRPVLPPRPATAMRPSCSTSPGRPSGWAAKRC
jgi:hypothetical protein